MASSECRIKRVLVANRGEIAVRIIRTLKEMGIESHSIFSESDKLSLHVKEADFSHSLGDKSDGKSYLNIKKIIQIAKKHKIDAVHPGYGFLSENSEFPKELLKNKIIFIGPSHSAMLKLGDKINAKKLAAKLKIPGLKIEEITKKTKFPLIIKAAGGGGGRGMRIVKNYPEAPALIESAKREAKISFNNESVFLERYLENARHIEVQVIADKYGDVRHLYDRDCSLQRNHQKIIEEAPALNIPVQVRKNIFKAACKLCKAAKYENLATVEFLLDNKNNFYFLEVNTRLQVEHTVTEAITGLDLVKLQLEISQGKRLSQILPEKIPLTGHAIQLRICAESPENNFSPAGGLITKFKTPVSDQIRLDTGYVQNMRVNHEFDSLIAKLIIQGETRDEVIEIIKKCLSQIELRGILSNLSFLSLICSHKKFKNNTVSTGFIRDFLSTISWENEYLPHIKDFYGGMLQKRFNQNDIWSKPTLFRITGKKTEQEAEFRVNSSVKLKLSIDVTEISKTGNFESSIYEENTGTYWFKSSLGPLMVEKVIFAGSSATQKSVNVKDVKANLPGKIIKLSVKDGQIVKPGDELIILESMKMEHIIRSEVSGIVDRVEVKLNSFVTPGAFLIKFK